MHAVDPKHPLPFPFGSLTDDEFDELVYLLAHAADDRVVKLRAPDGGLDTVRVNADEPLVAEWGIQAKRHRDHIKWPACKSSLDRAVRVWQAKAVTFAFPRDLTEPQHKLFHKHLTNRHPGVAVDWWGSTKLTALLLDTPSGRGIVKRFFHREDPVDLADRAIRVGRPLRTAVDLLEREGATGEFLRGADPHFDWVATKRTRSTAPVAKTPGAAMRLEFSKDDQQMIVDAVPRASSTPPEFAPRGALEFPTREDYERAHKLIGAVATLGGRADLGEVAARFTRIPAPFDELLTEPIRGKIVIRAEREIPSWPATISATTNLGAGRLDVDLAATDPGEEWDVVIAGQRHGLAVTLQFVWSHSEKSGKMKLDWRFTRATGTVEERAQVLGLLAALHGEGTFEIRDREGRRPPLTEKTTPAPLPEDIRMLARLYADLATVQQFAGATFGPPPDEFTYEEAQALAWLAGAVRDGGYDATLHNATMRCGSEALASFRRSGNNIEIREVMHADLFGRDLPIANRRVQLPLMVVKQAARVPGPEALWDVELLPATGDHVDVRFLLEPLDGSD